MNKAVLGFACALIACGQGMDRVPDAASPDAVVRDGNTDDVGPEADGGADAAVDGTDVDGGDAAVSTFGRVTRTTSGNGTTSSGRYRLRIRVGGPQPASSTAAASFRAGPR